MLSTRLTINAIAILFGIAATSNLAVAQETVKPKTAELMTMQLSPGVSGRVLRADELKGIKSEKLRVATVLEVVFDPMSGSPPHRHPGPLCGYVLEGTFEFQVEGGKKRLLEAGDTFYEPEMILHLIGRNPKTKGKTRVLATIIHPADAKQLVIPAPSGLESK